MATRFELHVRRQVLEFLQTILMIDDEAFRRDSGPEQAADEDWADDDTPPVGSALKLVAPGGLDP